MVSQVGVGPVERGRVGEDDEQQQAHARSAERVRVAGRSCGARPGRGGKPSEQAHLRGADPRQRHERRPPASQVRERSGERDDRDQRHRPAEQHPAQHPSLRPDLHSIAGATHLLAKVRVTGPADLEDLLHDLYRVEGVRNTRMHVALQTHVERLPCSVTPQPERPVAPSRR